MTEPRTHSYHTGTKRNFVQHRRNLLVCDLPLNKIVLYDDVHFNEFTDAQMCKDRKNQQNSVQRKRWSPETFVCRQRCQFMEMARVNEAQRMATHKSLQDVISCHLCRSTARNHLNICRGINEIARGSQIFSGSGSLSAFSIHLCFTHHRVESPVFNNWVSNFSNSSITGCMADGYVWQRQTTTHASAAVDAW